MFKFSTGLRLAVVPADRLLDIYFINAYRTPTDWFFTDFIEEKVYHTNGSDVVKIPKWFEYNNQNFMPSLTKTINSVGDTLKTEMKYPHDFSTDPIYAGMLTKNQSGIVIEQSEYVKKVDNNSYDFLMKKRTNFAKFNNTFYAPNTVETQYAGGILTQEASFQYTSDALISSVTERSGITSTFTWFGTADIGKRDLLKTMVKGSGSTIAQTSNFDYKPLVGLSIVTPPTTYATTYSYDALSRLNSVKDAQFFEMKRLFYHYRGQSKPTDLTLTLPKTSNYVASFTARNAQTTLDSVTNNSTVSLAYMDGLGKSIQQVLFKGSPDKSKDILLGTTVFDNQSRPKLTYLPTPSDVNTGVPNTDFQTLAKAFYDNDNNPYSETIYEESPLNRPLQTFGAGQAWRTANKFVAYDYFTAGGGFLDFKLTANGASGSTLGLLGNTLINSQITSERGAKTIELKDRLGRVLYKLQQLDINTFNYAITSYIYDDLNRLYYCLPPEINKQFGTNTEQLKSFTENDVIFKEGIYAYHYDKERGRVNEKHIPGAGWTRYVYDKNDRVVLENDDQDGANYWKMTRYDALSRPIMTGLLTGIGSNSRQTLQTAFDGVTTPTYEEIGTNLLGYTNRSFPTADIYSLPEANVKMVMYYDDYVWQTDANYNFQASNAFHSQANAKGMVTGKLVRNLRTNTWQKMVMYYDYKGRIIQSFHLSNRGNLIRKDFQYRFNDELLKIRIEKKSGSTVLSTKILSYEYDHLSRKIKFKYSLNGNEKTIATYSYDAISRMTQKLFSPSATIGSSQTGLWTNSGTWQGGNIPTLSDQVTINSGHTVTIPSGQIVTAGTLFDKGVLKNFGTLQMGTLAPSTGAGTLQVLEYKYHIRGGLKAINTDANNNLTNNLFSYKLSYEEDGTYFDGNIRNQYWKSNIDGKQRAYQYTYDGASRLKSASYASFPVGENYALDNVNYDANGNILALSRSGATNANYTAFGNVDNLTYTYQSNSNKLLKVQDATTGNTDLGDFRDGMNTDDDYDYWLDGSLKKDKNKGIDSLRYNYLKLTERVKFSSGVSINYEYDAEGTKLKKIVSNGETTDYEEDDIYVNTVLYQTSHDEGRIVNGVYEYNITDHNNDLRIAFKDSAGIAVTTQSIFYDPWGLSMKGMQITRNPLNFNRHQFLNRELQIETGLVDLMNRQYNPQTGRFTSQDPVIEGQEHLSLYQYGWNNPVLRSDPNGDCPFCPAIPFIPEIGAGLVAAGEAITGLLAGSATGTAIGVGVSGMADSKAFIPYGVQMVAHKVEGEMGQRNINTKQETMDKNSKDGKAREVKTDKELKAENPDSKVQGERYLRDKNGKIVKDPQTETGRRIDHAVIKDGKVTKLVETTSNTASKVTQADKEQRIRNEGGTFIRDKTDKKKLYDVSNVPTEIRRQN